MAKLNEIIKRIPLGSSHISGAQSCPGKPIMYVIRAELEDRGGIAIFNKKTAREALKLLRQLKSERLTVSVTDRSETPLGESYLIEAEQRERSSPTARFDTKRVPSASSS